MIKILLLSFIQGITEFLPISSSGHLILFEKILGYNPKGIGLEVFLHLSTSFSIIFYFSKKIFNFYKKYYKEVIVGIIPAGIIGVLFKNFFEKFFENPSYLPLFFLLNSIILFFSREKGNKIIKIKEAILIGISQIFAIFPGISRSGITIGTALISGCDKKSSFEFSFLMALPLIFGSFLIDIKGINLNIYNIFGFIFCFFVGLFSLYFLNKILKIKKFHYFSLYTFFLSIISFLIL
jgi:undecaprenyl-diphosphatase